MLVGILQAGKVNDALASKYGQYPPMFEDLFSGAAPEFRYRYYETVEGVLPASPSECDAWLVTGSRHGVYDPLPWIPRLVEFLRGARAASRPIVGICFGHQVVAEAFGGRAVKSEEGWGLGLHEYHVTARPGWMADAPDRFAMHAVHQDQVISLPEDAVVLARNGHCDIAMVAYGDAEAPDAVTIQPHPEFTAEFTRDLVDFIGREGRAPLEVAEAAAASIGPEVEAAGFARWIAAYLRLKEAEAKAA